jgi:hypothetical protein
MEDPESPFRIELPPMPSIHSDCRSPTQAAAVPLCPSLFYSGTVVVVNLC